MSQISHPSQAAVPFAPLVAPVAQVAEGVLAAAGLALASGAALARRLRAAWLQRRTIRALSALDDHLLRDIGVRRGDILQVAERCVSGRTDPGGRMA